MNAERLLAEMRRCGMQRIHDVLCGVIENWEDCFGDEDLLSESQKKATIFGTGVLAFIDSTRATVKAVCDEVDVEIEESDYVLWKEVDDEPDFAVVARALRDVARELILKKGKAEDHWSLRNLDEDCEGIMKLVS